MGNFPGSVAFGRWSWPGRPTSADGHRPAIGGHRMDGALTSQKYTVQVHLIRQLIEFELWGSVCLCTHEVIR